MFGTFKANLLASLACMGVFAAAIAQANSLESVNVSQGDGDSRVVKITLKDNVGDLPMHFTTTNPNRIVLDLADTDSKLGRISESVEAGIIKTYNVVEAGGRTRVVLNLAGPAGYDVRKSKNVLLISVQGTAAAAPVVAPLAVKPAAVALPNAVQRIDFKRGPEGSGRIEIGLSSMGIPVDVKQKGQSIQVELMDTALPANLQQRLDVGDFATPAQTVEAIQADRRTRVTIHPKGKWDYFAYQSGQIFVVEVKPLETVVGKDGRQTSYTGEKLSLSFHDEDVNALLKVIADFTGLNLVTSDSVKGKITLRLVDVPWDQALDIILRNKGLDKRSDGNVIWIAPREELLAKEKQEYEALQLAEDMGDLQTAIIRLNYMRANEAREIVLGNSVAELQKSKIVSCDTATSNLGGTKTTSNSSNQNSDKDSSQNSHSMLSKRGVATYDLKTNSLFVYDTSVRVEKIRKLMAEIDTPARQVMIEARVVVADDGFSRELGSKISLTDQVGAKVGNFQINDLSLGTTNLIGDAGSTVAFSILHTATGGILDLELSALESDQRGKVLSNPRVVTQNQQPAVILQGQQIPYKVQGEGTQQNTEFKDAVLCLLVDPQILNNDEVILDVEVRKDEAKANQYVSGGEPSINTKRVNTQVRLKNGETAILGGIFEQETSTTTSKVPLLGDIPGLGWLFKKNTKTDAKTELIIFLTPRLIGG